MKKLLLIFNLFLPTMTLSTNTISCNKNKNVYDVIKLNDSIIPSLYSASWYSNLYLETNIEFN